MSEISRVTLKPKRARPFFGRHPWVFENAIAKVERKPNPGDSVAVFSHEGKFIAYGLFNEHSTIRVRLLSWHENEPVSEELIARRLERAIEFRRNVLGLGDFRSACRLVYSESDELSGLIVDQYADVLVMQFGSLALTHYEEVIVATLNRLLEPRAILRRSDSAIRELESLEAPDGLVQGSVEGEEFAVDVNGLALSVNPLRGQKTGAYLDQRENYVAAARYANGESILDVYCNGGGFGLTAMKLGNGASLLGIDSSEHAVDLAKRNAAANGIAAEFVAEDAVAALQRMVATKRQFGMVILDPPKFARTAASLERAITAYERINTLAIMSLRPNGILVTCSCSGLVDHEMFSQILAASAQKAERHVQILEMRGQAPDHPVSALCLETSYLKCAIAHVS